MGFLKGMVPQVRVLLLDADLGGRFREDVCTPLHHREDHRAARFEL